MTEPTPIRSAPPWYTRVVGAAAALVVVAGLGYFLVDNSLLGGGGDSAESGQVAATTSAGAEDDGADPAAGAAPDAEQSAEATDETADADGTEEDALAATTAAEETVAAAETTVAAEGTPESLASDDAVTLSQTLDPVVAEAVDRVVARLRDTAQDRSAQSVARLDLSRAETSCLESLDLDEVLAVDSITARDRRLMVVSHEVAGTVEVEVVDLADCTQVNYER